MSIETGAGFRMSKAQMVRFAEAAPLVFAALSLSVSVASAQTQLTLGGGDENAEISEFTLEDLAGFPQATIVTEHSFADGKVAYRGPLVRNLIERLALEEGDALRFVAANDYSIEIPISDFTDYDVILAMEADGKPLSRREKGPLWLMYPISDNDELKDPTYTHRLIWQVVRIEPL